MLGLRAAQGFDTFVLWFAAPFAFWLVGILLSARAQWWRTHALLANMLLKSAIATPLSRLVAAGLQTYGGWPAEQGYYQGIFGTASVFAVWQAADLWAFATAAGHSKTS